MKRLENFPDLSNLLLLSQNVINMGRSRSIVRQGDIQRGLKAAKAAGLNVVRYEVDPNTGRLVFVVKEDGSETKVTVNPWNNAATPWSSRKGRK